MSRWLAIDYGEKRIGIAISDPLKMFVTPFDTIINDSDENVINALLEIFKSQKIEKIILGLPLNLAGEDTIKTGEIRDFYNKLTSKTSIPVELWDERYSTADAGNFLKQKGLNWKESRKHIDRIAAAIILKSYLDSQI